MDSTIAAMTYVRTPATLQVFRVAVAGDWQSALHVLDEHWAEIWYAVDPTDLRRLLAQAPTHLLSTLKNANFLARATGHGPVEDLLAPQQPPRRPTDLNATAQYIGDLRLRGLPAAAMEQVRRIGDHVRAGRGQLVDATGGTTALWSVQVGITALLAGDVATARGMLLEATTSHRPDKFPFIVREATAKLALTHAVAGNIVEAITWSDRARATPRTESWVEGLINDTIWLTDYLCAVDTLDPRAEAMRLAKPSPLEHLEFWAVALQAQVRHLTLTRRAPQAHALCMAVAAAGLPRPGADGTFATALSDAELSIIDGSGYHAAREPDVLTSAQAVLTEGLRLFVTGQFQAVLELAGKGLPPTHDDRTTLALRLLEAQSLTALGHPINGRQLLLKTLQKALDCQVLSSLRYLTAATLTSIRGTDAGTMAADLVDRHAVPTLELEPVLESSLTEAEVEVMRLLQQGRSRAEIAEELHLSINTVKTQLRSAYRKLNVTSRGDANVRFARLGL
ncbi:LuxR C-terminal-related transcriptional regulator [Georgenia sp. MJ173]|uniref:helix-turn-helix transcriptional regulator n=1 Tax=Georgenia sunbinii TaxID=3117728 RepID=UPI002F26AE25